MSVTDALLAFSLAALILTLTPGLDTALILRTASADGGKKAVQVALGINTGCLIWGGAVAFGLGALLAVSDVAYTLLKICGACYLAWLGVQLLLHPRASFSTEQQRIRRSNGFLTGLLGNILNPKMGIFYVSFLPQFVPVGHSPVIWIFLLVGIHIFMGTLWSLTLILTTHVAAAVLKKAAVVKWMDRITGGLFLLFAAKLAVSSR